MKMNYGYHAPLQDTLFETFSNVINEGKADVCQIFLGNKLSYARKNIDKSDIEKCKTLHMPFTIHSPYVFTLAKDANFEKTKEGLVKELQLCHSLYNSAIGVVIHPGSAESKNLQIAIDKIVDSIQFIYNNHPNLGTLLLENSCSSGNTVPRNLEQIQWIINHIPHSIQKHVGVCIDTCHSYAAGISDWNNPQEFYNKFDSLIGINSLKCIHLNDSKDPFGSNKDHHEVIGKGHIWGGISGGERIKQFFQVFENIPKISETKDWDSDMIFVGQYVK